MWRERRATHQQQRQGGKARATPHDQWKEEEVGGGVLRGKRTEEGKVGCLLGGVFFVEHVNSLKPRKKLVICVEALYSS